MSTDSPGTTTAQECEVAIEAAVGVALDHCVNDDELQRNIGRVLGVEPDPDCEASLEEGLDDETCRSSRGVRQWVLCRAHDMLKNQQVGFQEAMETAWAEAASQCDVDGSVV